MSDMTGYDMTCDRFTDQLPDYLEGDASETVREAMESHAAVCESCGALLADLMLIPEEAAALPALTPSRDLWSGIAERIDARVLPLDAGRSVRPMPSIRRGWVRPAIAAAALVLFTASVTHVLTRVSLTPSTTVASVPAPAPAQTVAAATPTSAVESGAPTAELTSTDTRRPDEPEARPARPRTARDASDRTSPPGAAPAGNPNLRLASARPLLHEAEPVYDNEISKLRKIVRDRRTQLDPATIAVLEQSVAVIDSAIAQSRAALAKDPASGFLATQLNHSLEKKVELLRTAAMLPSRT
jgi:hypothetical protein